MLLDMYRLVYNLFLKWGHAIKLPEPQWQDMEGKEVVEAMATGCKVEYKLLYQNRILTMDETGDNGNQSVDKINRIGGIRNLIRKCAKYLLVNSRDKNIFYFNELYFWTIQTRWNGDVRSD